MPEKHKPTVEPRAKVIGLSCNGATQGRIAEHLGVTEKTLRLHYREQIDFGVEALLSKVLGNLASIACKGRGMPAVAAAKYLLSCRGGYKEHSVLGVEPAGEYGVDAADVRERILAKLAAMADVREKLSAEVHKSPEEGEAKTG